MLLKYISILLLSVFLVSGYASVQEFTELDEEQRAKLSFIYVRDHWFTKTVDLENFEPRMNDERINHVLIYLQELIQKMVDDMEAQNRMGIEKDFINFMRSFRYTIELIEKNYRRMDYQAYLLKKVVAKIEELDMILGHTKLPFLDVPLNKGQKILYRDVLASDEHYQHETIYIETPNTMHMNLFSKTNFRRIDRKQLRFLGGHFFSSVTAHRRIIWEYREYVRLTEPLKTN